MSFDPEVAKRRLPKELHSAILGVPEIDIFDVILNMQSSRTALLEGPRGAGKTSLLHYVEAIAKEYLARQRVLFVILDGLELAEQDSVIDEAIVIGDYAAIIYAALTLASKSLSRAASIKIRNAIEKSRLENTQTSIRELFRDVALILKPQKALKLVIAFDNLDHLADLYTRVALNLARQITVVTDFTCLICLRDNVSESLFHRGDARAFFQFRIPVYPPDVEDWIKGLGRKAEYECNKWISEGYQPPVVLGKLLTPDDLRQAFDRFAHIISLNRGSKRRRQDDALPMIQAMAADDTRHLQILIRRILSDARLPTAYLIGASTDWEFHPIGALLEGSRTIFVGDRYIPNLLTFEYDLGNPDLLIVHRVLCLLERPHSTTLSDLLQWMQLLGYEVSSVLEVLYRLSGPLVIRCAEGDTFRIEAPPRAVHLTEAGYFYRDHFLHNADYLTSAILDVSLEHNALRRLVEDRPQIVREGRFFVEKVRSLLEYVNLVIEREQRQVFGRLQGAPPSSELRRVADALRNGDLLTRSIIDGLEAIVARSASSQETSVRKLVDDINIALEDLKIKVQRIEKRLGELVNRGRKSNTIRHDSLHYLGPGRAEVNFRSDGDDIEATATINASSADVVVLVSLSMEIDGRNFSHTAVAVPSSLSLRGDGRIYVTASMPVPNYRSEQDKKPTGFSTLEFPRSNTRALFLSLNEREGGVQLILNKLSNGARAEALGPVVPLDKLEAESARVIERVGSLASSRGLKHQYIREAGTALAQLLLNPAGANRLASLVACSETVIIHSTETESVIPLEWLCPWAIRAENVIPLSHSLNTVRWVGTEFEAANQIHCWRGPRPAQKMCTVGLAIDTNKPWRQIASDEPDDLAQLCASFDVVHVVGHWKDDEKVIEITRGQDPPLEISIDTARSFAFCGENSSVIFSVCDLARLHRKANIALQTAELRPAVVWASLAKIRLDDVTALDERLAHYISSPSSLSGWQEHCLEDFFKNEKQTHPWVQVYVRYGL